jgi:hypothetical protein
MATGGLAQGKPPLEVGASQLDFDYLHIVNWKKAEDVLAAGKFAELNGIRVISLETAVAEGLLFLAPEPRSPHGVDVAPKGDYITVSGLEGYVAGIDLRYKTLEKADRKFLIPNSILFTNTIGIIHQEHAPERVEQLEQLNQAVSVA